MDICDSTAITSEGYGQFCCSKAFSGSGEIRRIHFAIEMKRGPFVTKKRLIQSYGWTRSLINRFLGDPDKRTRNKHNRNRKTALYNINRVERVQMSSEFRVAFQQANKRRLATAKAIETKRRQVEPKLKHLAIHVEHIDRYDVVYDACESYKYSIIKEYGRHDFEIIKNELCRGKYDEYILDPVVVDYVRHKLTTILEEGEPLLLKPINRKEVNKRMKKKVLMEIANIYPWLSRECGRQIEAIHESFTIPQQLESA